MEIVDVAAMAWGENLVPHRQGYMAHKQIFSGAENSPDNFALVLAKESADYYSPGHRHNWDQLRYCLEGGVFRRRSGAGKKNQDAYEAIWQRSFGQAVSYPEPRYRAPIVMRPPAPAIRTRRFWKVRRCRLRSANGRALGARGMYRFRRGGLDRDADRLGCRARRGAELIG